MKRTSQNRLMTLAGLAVFSLAFLAGCSGGDAKGGEAATGGGAGKTSAVSGPISIDGSSTVAPIMEAMSEEFGKVAPGVSPTVATSGTGGGFKKFLNGEIDIANASRPIEEKEIATAKEKGIEFVEVPVAFDGLSVMVNPKNSFVTSLTVAQLKQIWEPNSTIKTWKDLNPAWPAGAIKLYGPGTDSGTFDYFTKAIVGTEKASRTDYQASEDDNTLVAGVSGDEFSLGYFGFAYYEQNKDKLKLVPIDGGKGPVTPSAETIADGTYQPLSRPLFIYVNKKALDEKPQIMEFIKFILKDGRQIVRDTGYIPLPDAAYDAVQKHVEEKRTGSLFKGAEVGVKIEEILARETAAAGAAK